MPPRFAAAFCGKNVRQLGNWLMPVEKRRTNPTTADSATTTRERESVRLKKNALNKSQNKVPGLSVCGPPSHPATKIRLIGFELRTQPREPRILVENPDRSSNPEKLDIRNFVRCQSNCIEEEVLFFSIYTSCLNSVRG